MLDQLTTLTGVPATELATRLAAPFTSPKAYKRVPGGANLTDINTGYMLERATEVFGPRGLGWALEYVPEAMEVFDLHERRPTAWLKNATFRYALLDPEGQMHWYAIQTSGASTNELAYAPEGARTSALGAALKALCFQLPIYKGDLDHHNAAKVLASPGKPGPEPPQPSRNGSGPATPPVPELPAPAAFVIPLGKNEGKTLGEVSPKAVEWYATQMQPATPAADALQQAAQALLAVRAARPA